MEQTVALKVLVNTNNTWIRASYHFYSLLDQYVCGNSKSHPRNILNYPSMSVFSLLSNSNQGTLDNTVITMQSMDNSLVSSVPMQEKEMVISLFTVLQIRCDFPNDNSQ